MIILTLEKRWGWGALLRWFCLRRILLLLHLMQIVRYSFDIHEISLTLLWNLRTYVGRLCATLYINVDFVHLWWRSRVFPLFILWPCYSLFTVAVLHLTKGLLIKWTKSPLHLNCILIWNLCNLGLWFLLLTTACLLLSFFVFVIKSFIAIHWVNCWVHSSFDIKRVLPNIWNILL